MKENQRPHVIKRRDSIEDYYWNEHLPLGFFINNGAEAGNSAPRQGAGLFGSGFGGSSAGQAFARSGIPVKPKV